MKQSRSPLRGRQGVDQGGRRRLSLPILNEQSRFKHDVLTDWNCTMLKYRAHLMGEPIIQLGAPAGIGDELHVRLGFGPAQLGKNDRVEQPIRQRSTPETGMRQHGNSISILRRRRLHRGDERVSLEFAVQLADVLAAITTTSSRPCTVTCWGPSLRMRRMSSLRRALASCKRHWPDCRSGSDKDYEVLVILTRIAPAPLPLRGFSFN